MRLSHTHFHVVTLTSACHMVTHTSANRHLVRALFFWFLPQKTGVANVGMQLDELPLMTPQQVRGQTTMIGYS